MHLFRPVREGDLGRLVDLAAAAATAGGLTTLPKDESFLGDRIDDSLRAFRPKVRQPGSEHYLFVLEDEASGTVVGTSGIAARVGGHDPFYSYEIRRERFAHAPLKIEKEMAVLHLRETHRGPTEIGSLFLPPDHRRGGLGRLLSLARFLFIRAFPTRFDRTIIAELRGYIDQQGKSPFWEAVGRHFFEHDYYTADFLSGLGQKDFIADLMPDHPIYVSLLPPEVQAVIGRVHHDTQPALALLQAEGFELTDEIDIFDAGPLVRASVERLRTIRHARTASIAAVLEHSAAPPTHLISNDRLDFAAVLGTVQEEARASTITLPASVAVALKVKTGDAVTFAPLR